MLERPSQGATGRQAPSVRPSSSARGLLARLAGSGCRGGRAARRRSARLLGRHYEAACLALEVASSLDDAGHERGAAEARARANELLAPLGCVNAYWSGSYAHAAIAASRSKQCSPSCGARTRGGRSPRDSPCRVGTSSADHRRRRRGAGDALRHLAHARRIRSAPRRAAAWGGWRRRRLAARAAEPEWSEGTSRKNHRLGRALVDPCRGHGAVELLERGGRAVAASNREDDLRVDRHLGVACSIP